MKYPPLNNFFAGAKQPSAGRHAEVTSPLDGSQLTSVPYSTSSELDQAVRFAESAQMLWAQQTLKQRADCFYRYLTLLERDRAEIGRLVSEENGKTPQEGQAEVDKAIEVTQFACSMPQMLAGEVMEVSPGVECRLDHVPLGVVASITPFNFPCMVPHWTIPIAIMAGNAMILKPSEQTPVAAQKTAELLSEAGLPAGIFSVLHGSREIVELICDHPTIAAVTFVGSTRVAADVYRRATSQLKRALAMGGAKNHLVVLPDADPEAAAENIVASMSGCAGQRCMAAATLLAVGDVEQVIEKVQQKSAALTLGDSLGAVISPAARERITLFIDEAEAAGATVLVDGRNAKVQGLDGGSYVGPTVLDGVTDKMRIAQEEVFGPVLSIIRIESMQQALDIENQSPYGNAAAIYTQGGDAAKHFAERASAGMIGVNIGVPVPREPFGFGGWNDSRFGAGDITGKSSIGFWTQTRKTTTRWN